jgi:hypothetical protein
MSCFAKRFYQNGSSSTGIAVRRAEALKNSFTDEVESCQTRPKNQKGCLLSSIIRCLSKLKITLKRQIKKKNSCKHLRQTRL